MIPQAGRTVWRYHVVDSDRSLATPQMLDFCYMATPVKPVTNWYAQRVAGDASYDMTNTVTELGQPYTGTSNYVANAVAIGIRQMSFHEQWTPVMGYPGVDAAHAGNLSWLAGAFQTNGLNLCLYSQQVLSDAAPEFNRWGAEWSATWPAAYGAFTRDTNFSGVVPQSVFWCSQNSAWSDFYIWNWLRLQQNYGVSGVYLDGTFGPVLDSNPNRPNAYIVNGVCRPTWPIYATREFMKRWYKTAKGQNPSFFFLGHASDAFTMPSASFLDYGMGGEEFWQREGRELDWSLLRAAYTGRQFGIRRDLYTTGVYQEPYLVPLAMVHGIGIFGRGASTITSTYAKSIWDAWDSFGVSATNCTWVPYWKGTPAVTSSTPDVKVSYYKRPGTILLCAATNKRARPAASVSINLAALGINPNHFSVKRFGQSIINSNQVNGTLTLSFLDNLSNPSGVADYVIITDTNRAPVATPRSISTAWQTPVAITLAGTDADGDTLNFAVDSPPAHGLLSGAAPALTYTPDASFSGTDSFTFHANDGWTNSASATITIVVGLAPPSVIVASDNFVTDPFATNRWSTTYRGAGYYPLLWTGSSNPNGFGGPSVSLPTNANAHSVYSFSTGTRTMSTTDTSVPAGSAGWTAMSYTVDFQMGGTGGTDNNSIEVLVNRNGTNGYKAAIYTGGSGHIAWYGDYGLAWTSPNLYVAANTWYRFETTVTRNGADLSMQSRILNLGGNVLATSPTTNFTSAAYTDPHGFKLTLSNGGGYWNHASQIDNFVVKVAPGSVTRPTLNWTNPGGGQLQFSWTGSGSLQWQTNSLNSGLGTNWVDYPGGGTSPVNVTVNPAQGSVFFRVRVP